jgi:hypothetical protein
MNFTPRALFHNKVVMLYEGKGGQLIVNNEEW